MGSVKWTAGGEQRHPEDVAGVRPLPKLRKQPASLPGQLPLFPDGGDNFETVGPTDEVGPFPDDRRRAAEAAELLRELCFTFHGPATRRASDWLSQNKDLWNA